MTKDWKERANKFMSGDIKEILSLLSGKKLSSVWRTSHILWLGIGDLMERTGEDGKIIKESEFTIEIQSAWRITNDHSQKIIVASSDIFSPNSALEKEENFDWDTFEWDIQGNNLLDEKLKVWFEESPLYIQECKVNVWGNLLIIFSNNECLEVFVNTSDYIKCWILSHFQDDEELIITGIGYEISGRNRDNE